MRQISHPIRGRARRTVEVSVTEFTLPALDRRALARRAVVPAVLGAFVVAGVIVLGGRIPAVAGVLRRAFRVNGGWVAVGAVLEVLSLAGYVALLAFVAGRASSRVRLRESALITLGGAAATRLLPTAGAGGFALTLWALRRTGMRTLAATRTLLGFLVVLYTVFLAAIVVAGGVLALGLVTSHGPVALSAIPAAAALLAILVGLALAATGGPARLRLLGVAVRDAFRLVATGDLRLAGAIAYWGFDAGVLWAMLHAFGAAPALPVLALAYFVGQVANTLPLPGSVSGGIAGVLIAFGVPGDIALPAVLAYRTVAVWLPTPVAIAAIPGLRATVARWEREDAGGAPAAAPAVAPACAPACAAAAGGARKARAAVATA
jgi:uncharacterized membrane protein YbhN (UPF0104 family)